MDTKRLEICAQVQQKPPSKTDGGFCTTRVYKPGSVLTAIYLGPKLLLGSSRLLETVGQTYVFLHGVASG